jgi:hypothetical protein
MLFTPQRLERIRGAIVLRGEGLWFRLSERLTGYRRERLRFEKKLGYPLNLKHPKSFNEKMCWRKIYDRNPLFPIIVDKVAVREYISDVLGKERAERVLIPLFMVAQNPRDIPFQALPREFVIKASHGSGMNLLVRETSQLTADVIVRKCEDWLRTPYGVFKHEWAYQRVVPRIVIEPLLKNTHGGPVREFKLHMFDGKCGLIQAHAAKVWDDGSRVINGDAPTLTFYTADWSRIDVCWVYKSGPSEPRPAQLQEIMEIAEVLSRPFDYIRVDFYITLEGIKVGELTPYHLSGTGRLEPMEFDFELGSKWRLRV